MSDSTPLSIGCDITPGPDGKPWVRVQVATVAVGAIFAFPIEHAGEISDGIVNGIAQAVQAAEKEAAGVQALDIFQTIPEASRR